MWIAEKMTEKRSGAAAERGTVSIGGEASAVLADGEVRNLAAAAPGGYVWRPRGGAQVLVLKGEERCILAALPEKNTVSLEPGEVCIHSGGGAAIYLRNDGRIELVGEVYINGAALEQTEE